MNTRPLNLLAIGALGLLVACGPSSEELRTERVQRESRQSTAAAQDAARQALLPATAGAEFVSAVSSAQRDTLVDLKFKLGARPQVGAPLAIELWLMPDAAAEVTALQLSLKTEESLRIETERNQRFEAPVSGTPLSFAVTVIPEQAGVHTLKATVLIESSTVSISRTYSIPLIVM